MSGTSSLFTFALWLAVCSQAGSTLAQSEEPQGAGARIDIADGRCLRVSCGAAS